MKKIILTESQVKKILNERMYPQIEKLYDKSDLASVKTHEAPDGFDAAGIAGELHKAMNSAWGTDNDLLKSAMEKITDFPSLIKVKKAFASISNNGDLLDWLDSDIDYDKEWVSFVWNPLKKAEANSEELGHFSVTKDIEEEKINKQVVYNFKKTFPCLEGEDGFEITKAKKTKGVEELFFNCDRGTFAVRLNGDTWINYGDGKMTKLPNKVSCPKKAEDMELKEQLVGLPPKQGSTTPTTDATPTTGTTTTGTTTTGTGTVAPEKPKVVTKLMTGKDVIKIQTILHKQGFGDIVGSVDGKLGPKTLAGIKQLFLGSTTRPKIEAITKGIQPIQTKTPEPQLAEEIQKNFKRFL